MNKQPQNLLKFSLVLLMTLTQCLKMLLIKVTYKSVARKIVAPLSVAY